MATVTSYTAERMKVIEDQSIIDGDVVGNDLILTPRGFATAPATYPKINAGNVRGPVGPQGVPGEVTDAELAAAITATKAEVRVPAGTLSMFGGDAAPTGYLLCDGAEASRTTYADLFAVLGTKYGVGNGTTTFNLPDLRNRFPVGKGPTAFSDTLNKKGGNKDAVLVSHSHTTQAHAHNTPNHQHVIGAHAHDMSHNHDDVWSQSGDNAHTHSATTDVQGQHSHAVAGAPIWANFGGGTLGMDQSGTGHSGVPSNLGSLDQAGGHSHQLITSQTSIAHQHIVSTPQRWQNTGTQGAYWTDAGTGSGVTDNQAPNTNAAGVAATDANLPPFITVNFIVKI